MPSMKQLEDQGRALLEDQKKLVNNDSRPWSEKKAEFENRQADIDAVLAQHAALKNVDGDPFSASSGDGPGRTLRGLQAGIAANGYTPIAAPQMDLSDDQLRDLHGAAREHRSMSVDTTSFKNATDSTTIAPATIKEFVLPPVPFRREPTRVLSLLPTFASNHATVEWYSTTGTAAADAVAEGGTKPTSTIAYTAQTTSATKLAHVAEVTDETLADFSGFMAVLQFDMVAGLYKAENNELLNATVTGAHKWPGMLAASGILTRAVGADTRLDAILKGFDDLRAGSALTVPDGIIMNPADWGTIRRLKDANNDYYLSPNPTAAPAGGEFSLWGIPVAVTTQIPAGTALLGSFGDSVAVYVREGIRVETNNQGEAQFKNNTTLVRAEERLILTVPRPTGLLKLTGL